MENFQEFPAMARFTLRDEGMHLYLVISNCSRGFYGIY